MMDEYLGGAWTRSYVNYFIRIKCYFRLRAMIVELFSSVRDGSRDKTDVMGKFKVWRVPCDRGCQ
jgi:hypothetical protein